MRTTAYVNGAVLLPNGKRTTGLSVIVSNGHIVAIQPDHDVPADAHIVDLEGQLLAPGFVDLQVNGGGGALFNDAPTVDTIRTIAAAHYQFGTTSFLPTLISDDLGKIREAYAAVNAAIAAGVPGVVGVHIEGPFLNAQRKGIHDDSKIRQLDDSGLQVILADRPDITMMTLAPECVSLDQIRCLSEAGIRLFAGHSEGTYQEIRDSFDAGVMGVTHLFNAMSPLTGREPGAVGAALSSPGCWCSIIVDGVHVHPETLKLAIKAKGGTDHFVLVTDAMPTVGQAAKSFVLNGEPITVRDGVCQNSDGTLAGSDLDMASAVANGSELLGLSQETSIRLATENPARLLGVENRCGSIAVGYEANMVQIDASSTVVRTWIKGQLLWHRSTAPVVA